MENRIFIFYKHSDSNGGVTEDYSIAKAVYDELIKRNVSAFFSNVTLFQNGQSAYKKAIDHALDQARLLIVV